MYLQSVENILTGQHIKIKYDCNGGFKTCGTEATPIYQVAKKNADAHNGLHICRSCQMRANNPAKREAVKEKIKKTNLERYGSTTAMNTTENIENRKKLFENKDFVNKRNAKTLKTVQEKYGTDHVMHLDSFKEKQKAAMQEKYGVDHPYQSPEIMAKMKAKNKEKYGVENVAQLPEVQIKMAKTTLERYGVEHYNQLPEMKDYLAENCKEWLAESWEAGGPNKGVVRPKEWNKKQRETVSKLIQSGNWAGGFKSNIRGRYTIALKCKKKNPRFLSSLELQLHFYLNNNKQIEWYDYESFSIPYKKDDNSDHLYFPDFLVKYFNDSRLHILETKTWKEKDSISVQLKQSAAIDYADQNDMTYTILFDEDVKKLGINLEKLKTMPGVELY